MIHRIAPTFSDNSPWNESPVQRRREHVDPDQFMTVMDVERSLCGEPLGPKAWVCGPRSEREREYRLPF